MVFRRPWQAALRTAPAWGRAIGRGDLEAPLIGRLWQTKSAGRKRPSWNSPPASDWSWHSALLNLYTQENAGNLGRDAFGLALLRRDQAVARLPARPLA